MPVVPTEENKIGVASISGAKFEAADLSGTGLQALGAGMETLGETGQKVAGEEHQAAVADDAAVKAAWNAYSDQARAIRENFYAQRGAAAIAALKPSIDALDGTAAALRGGLANRRQQQLFDRAIQGARGYDMIGLNAHATTARGVEQDDQSVIAQKGAATDAVHNADNPEFATKLLDTGVESIRTQAMLQGRDPSSVDEQVAKYRSSAHLDVILGPKGHDPLAANHYLVKNSGDMIEPHKREAAQLLAPALGQLKGVADIDSYPMLSSATEPATPPGDFATVTSRILDVEAARQAGAALDKRSTEGFEPEGASDAAGPTRTAPDSAGMLTLVQRYRGSAPKSLAASLLGTDAVDALIARHGPTWFGALPAETREAVAHDMGMLGASTSPREAPPPEDHAAIADWIDAHLGDDARGQMAHEELHTRIGLERRRLTKAQDEAKEAAFALAGTLGAGFISINQLPPAVRRDLGDDALSALTLRADRNVHPMTVAAHGDVAMDLNRMAATDPEAFAKQDLRLHRDEMTPAEYGALEQVQKAWNGYPPAAAGVTQQRAMEKVRASGLDVSTPISSSPQPEIVPQAGRREPPRSRRASATGKTKPDIFSGSRYSGLGPAQLGHALAASARDDRAIGEDARNRATPATRKRIILGGGALGTISVADNPKAKSSASWYELPRMSEVPQNEKYIGEMSKKYGVDADLIRAIIYIESTHGYYDAPLDLAHVNSSIRPMNVNVKYWGGAFGWRNEVADPRTNIEVGTQLLKAIINSMPGANIAKIATIYNNTDARKVSDYGARVSEIYKTKAWNKKFVPTPIKNWGAGH